MEGWRIPTMKDYNDMKDMLVSYGASMPALKMFDDNARLAKDLTGFNLKFQGYWEGSNKTNEGKRSAFWANIPVGGSTYTTAVFLDKSGEMQTGPNEYASTAVNIGALVSQYSVRIVMK
ncbi:MAG: fibrobacter succinogenes major paralogous domain-containing protein [Prevotella sp.]|nr:fibrobacter succinogenes major paralogous domain-containing protein [Prevotella sp.]